MFCYQFQLVEIHAANERLLSWLHFPLIPLHQFKQSQGWVTIWFIKTTYQTKISLISLVGQSVKQSSKQLLHLQVHCHWHFPGEGVGALNCPLAGT